MAGPSVAHSQEWPGIVDQGLGRVPLIRLAKNWSLCGLTGLVNTLRMATEDLLETEGLGTQHDPTESSLTLVLSHYVS